jgi:hypothetical protein
MKWILGLLGIGIGYWIYSRYPSTPSAGDFLYAEYLAWKDDRDKRLMQGKYALPSGLQPTIYIRDMTYEEFVANWIRIRSK